MICHRDVDLDHRAQVVFVRFLTASLLYRYSPWREVTAQHMFNLWGFIYPIIHFFNTFDKGPSTQEAP